MFHLTLELLGEYCGMETVHASARSLLRQRRNNLTQIKRGLDERKMHSPRAWTLSLQYYALNAHKNQLTVGRVLDRRLLLELPIEGRRNIHGGSHRFFFHGTTIASLA